MDHYIDRSDLDNARASPLLHTNFNTLPPALIILAELDALRDEGIGKHGLHFCQNDHSIHYNCAFTIYLWLALWGNKRCLSSILGGGGVVLGWEILVF